MNNFTLLLFLFLVVVYSQEKFCYTEAECLLIQGEVCGGPNCEYCDLEGSEAGIILPFNNTVYPNGCEARIASHVPEISYNSTTKLVTVTVPHEGIAGDDVTDHYLDYVYMKDQHDDIIGETIFDSPPTEEIPFYSVDFEVPCTASFIKPYEHCNLHGLWEGDSLDVSSSVSCGKECNSHESCLELQEFVCVEDTPSYETGCVYCNMPSYEGNKDLPFSQVNDAPTGCNYLGSEHYPLFWHNADTDTVTVYLNHPGTEDHYMTYIYIQNQDGITVSEAFPGPGTADAYNATFTIPCGTTTLTPFTHCNKHGLWEGIPIDVPSDSCEELCSSDETCLALNAELCSNDAVTGSCSYCDVSYLEHGVAEYFDNETYPDGCSGFQHEHVPEIIFNEADSQVIVTVPHGGTFGHWIQYVQLKDQHGNVIDTRFHNEPLASGEYDMDSYTQIFDLPCGVTEVTAYEHCNIHGFWKSEPIPVVSSKCECVEDLLCLTLNAQVCNSTMGCEYCEDTNSQYGLPTYFSVGHAPDGCEAMSNSHVPTVTYDSTARKVTVLIPHTGDPEHWITYMFIKNQYGVVFGEKYFDQPTQTTTMLQYEVTFDVPCATTHLTAFQHCNLHGTWESETIEIPSYNQQPCSTTCTHTIQCLELNGKVCSTDAPLQSCTYCDLPDYESGLVEAFTQTTYPEGCGSKFNTHVPLISYDVDTEMATVSVPHGGVTDHYLTYIYVMNENGVTVFNTTIDPPTPGVTLSSFTYDFHMPCETTVLTAFEHCNLHGFWAGEPTTIFGCNQYVDPGDSVEGLWENEERREDFLAGIGAGVGICFVLLCFCYCLNIYFKPFWIAMNMEDFNQKRMIELNTTSHPV